jgi:photosystem II PsbU protein
MKFFFPPTILVIVVSSIVVSTSTTVSAFAPAIRTIRHNHGKHEVKLDMVAAMNRRDAIFNAAVTATTITVAAIIQPAFALNSEPADNEIVKEQRQVTDKLDINNAPVADYMQLRGMYPTIGGKISNQGPYSSVKDLYKLQSLSKEEKSTIKKYENFLTATPSTGLDTMRGRDPYRRNFNK